MTILAARRLPSASPPGDPSVRRRRGVTVSVVVLVVALVGAAPARAQARDHPCPPGTDRPWCDDTLDPDRRADLLLAELTTDEKISLLGGEELFGAAGEEGSHTGTSHGIDRLGLPTMYFSDGPVGPRQGQGTQMPSPMSLASTFSADAARRHAAVIGTEVRLKGNDVVFAPAVNLMRTPLNGRTFEYFGEDPTLSSLITAGWVQGVQAEGIIGSVKHYAVNNQEGVGVAAPGAPIGAGVIGSRVTLDAQVDERTMREMYLPSFRAAVDAGVGTVMCAYNRVNSDYACENEVLLRQILKGDWGFDGFVLSDYGAAKNTIDSLNQGLDLDIWPGIVYSPTSVQAALASGLVTMETVDEHVHRILRTMFAFGLFDREPYLDDDTRVDVDLHHDVAGQLAAEGTVLLRNDGGILPLDETAISTLAVIGPEADLIKDGGGSSAIDAYRTTTPLQALVDRLGQDRVVVHDGSDADAAAAVAAAADVAVVVVGDNMTEGKDKTAPTLDADQVDGIDRDALVSAVADTQPRTVVAMQAGGPVLTPWREQVPGILQLWYPGQNGGTALARVLFGEVDPGGRLPATFPVAAEDLPTAGDPRQYPGVAEVAVYSEGVLIGYRHFDANGIDPAFPFGHGLSYTTFELDGLRVRPAPAGSDAMTTVSYTVSNTGDRTGTAVPQVYVGLPAPDATTIQPPRQLRHAARVELDPGQARRVTAELGPDDLSYFDVEAGGWRVAPGCYTIELGYSSRNLVDEAVLPVEAECAAAAPSARGPQPPGQGAESPAQPPAADVAGSGGEAGPPSGAPLPATGGGAGALVGAALLAGAAARARRRHGLLKEGGTGRRKAIETLTSKLGGTSSASTTRSVRMTSMRSASCRLTRRPRP